ncbi:putative glutathione reductase [Neisseria meningitidis NM3042]|nr:putative glutathione reductase [Neisseria meningitidis NM3042]
MAFLGAACRISINGKYYAGNRIVWFAKKAES